MKISEQFQEIAKALSLSQGEMQAAEKDKTNPHFGQGYATLAAVWDAIRAPITKNGLSVVQITEVTAQGMILHTRLMHTSGQFIESSYDVGRHANPQQLGSALTYARRYSLASLVGVTADEDDDGNAASQGKNRNQDQKPKPQSAPRQQQPAQPRQNAPQSQTSPAAAQAPVITPPSQGSQSSQAPETPTTQIKPGKIPGPGQPQLEELKAVAKANNWLGASVTEYMDKKYEAKNLGALTMEQYQELLGTIKSKSHTAADEELTNLKVFSETAPTMIGNQPVPAQGGAA